MKKYTWRLRSDWEMIIPCACCLCFWVGLPFPKLRARTFKWMVGRRSFPFGMAQPGRCELLVSGRVSLFTKLILQETLECCQVLPAKSREWIYRIPPNTVGSPTAKIWKDLGTDRLYGNTHWTKFTYEVMKASKIPQWNTGETVSACCSICCRESLSKIPLEHQHWQWKATIFNRRCIFKRLFLSIVMCPLLVFRSVVP